MCVVGVVCETYREILKMRRLIVDEAGYTADNGFEAVKIATIS